MKPFQWGRDCHSSRLPAVVDAEPEGGETQTGRRYGRAVLGLAVEKRINYAADLRSEPRAEVLLIYVPQESRKYSIKPGKGVYTRGGTGAARSRWRRPVTADASARRPRLAEERALPRRGAGRPGSGEYQRRREILLDAVNGGTCTGRGCFKKKPSSNG